MTLTEEFLLFLALSSFGIFLIVMSWGSIIVSKKTGKYHSPAPFGGAIMLVFLFSRHFRLLALTALLDPVIWIFLRAVILEKKKGR